MTSPACQEDPDAWFNPAARTRCLAHCLACPARRACARTALHVHASSGMWAGVWVDEDHPRAARTPLLAIAETAAQPVPVPPPAPREIPTPAGVDDTLQLLARDRASAIVRARSSGHCEILLDTDCRYTSETRIARTADDPHTATDPTLVLAACRPCRQAVAALSEPDKTHYGFRVPEGYDPHYSPVLWRGRWAYLDGSPVVIDAGTPTTAAG